MPTKAPCRAEKRVFLADQRAAVERRSIGRILPGTARQMPPLLALAWLVKTVMNKLSPVRMRLPAPSSAPSRRGTAAGCRRQRGLEVDAAGHVHHRAGFGHRAFSGVGARLRQTASRAVDRKVDVVGPPATPARLGGRRGPTGRSQRPEPPKNSKEMPPDCGTSLSGVQFFMPSVNTSVLPSMVALPQVGNQTSSCEDRSDLVPANGHVPLLVSHRSSSRGVSPARSRYFR